jgi:hypothetical protein
MRFRLSISGRIAIVKTLLIPQINYLGCILTPSRTVLDGIQSMLDDFALNNIPCAKSRRYLPPDKGGLGLIHVGTFLMAQKCSWIKRAHANTIDTWRLNLKLLSPGFNISDIRIFDLSKLENPILFNIVEAFEVFRGCYNRIGNNYVKSKIFCNPCFVRSKNDSGLLDKFFFGISFFNRYKNAIRSLTFEDCFIDNEFRTIADFGTIGLPVTQIVWVRLRNALLLAKSKYKKVEDTEVIPSPPKSVEEFLGTVKKGSKKFRTVIDKSVYSTVDVSDLTAVLTFCDINEVECPPNVILEHFFSSWNSSFLENNLREFILKCRYNLLKTNDRLSHVLTSIDQTCFLCNCLANGSNHRETFNHLFRKCPVVVNLIQRFIFKMKINITNENAEFDQLYWFGNNNGILDRNTLLVFDIFRYHLWLCKKQRIFPRVPILVDRTCATLEIIFRVKPSIKKSVQNNVILANILQVTG